MIGMEPHPKIEPAAWNRIIAGFPQSHVLQTWEWGEIKARHGWEPIQCLWIKKGDAVYLVHEVLGEEEIWAAALVLRRVIPVVGKAFGMKLLYAPKGPLVSDWRNVELCSKVIGDLKRLAQREKAILIKIDPDVSIGYGTPEDENDQSDAVGLRIAELLEREGWLFSNEQVQFRNTVLIDLRQSEESLLARMKQKTRYNIRLASRKGVEIRVGAENDLGELYEMYAETAVRDGFVLREAGYYLDVWKTFLDAGMAEPLIACVDGKAVAAVIIFRFARKAWYFYGMSRQEHREKMPNYLLQWEAMRRAKSSGCEIYDFWGAPDEFNEFDPMWKVYRFKEGYGGVVTRFIGAWDYPVSKSLYWLYTQVAPRLLSLMRKQGLSRLKHSISQ